MFRHSTITFCTFTSVPSRCVIPDYEVLSLAVFSTKETVISDHASRSSTGCVRLSTCFLSLQLSWRRASLFSASAEMVAYYSRTSSWNKTMRALGTCSSLNNDSLSFVKVLRVLFTVMERQIEGRPKYEWNTALWRWKSITESWPMNPLEWQGALRLGWISKTWPGKDIVGRCLLEDE